LNGAIRIPATEISLFFFEEEFKS